MNDTNLNILREAEKVFARQGFLGTSIHHIAKACKLGVATLYHYYGNKEEILFAILEKNLRRHLDELNEHLSGITHPISQLEKYIWFQFHFCQKYPEHSKLILLEFRNRSGLENLPAYQHMKEMVNQLIPILHKGQEAGLFDKDIDAFTFRNLIWGTLEAFTRNWLIFEKPSNIVDYAPVVTQRILKAIRVLPPVTERPAGKDKVKPRRGKSAVAQ